MQHGWGKSEGGGTQTIMVRREWKGTVDQQLDVEAVVNFVRDEGLVRLCEELAEGGRAVFTSESGVQRVARGYESAWLLRSRRSGGSHH